MWKSIIGFVIPSHCALEIPKLSCLNEATTLCENWYWLGSESTFKALGGQGACWPRGEGGMWSAATTNATRRICLGCKWVFNPVFLGKAHWGTNEAGSIARYCTYIYIYTYTYIYTVCIYSMISMYQNIDSGQCMQTVYNYVYIYMYIYIYAYCILKNKTIYIYNVCIHIYIYMYQ